MVTLTPEEVQGLRNIVESAPEGGKVVWLMSDHARRLYRGRGDARRLRKIRNKRRAPWRALLARRMLGLDLRLP